MKKLIIGLIIILLIICAALSLFYIRQLSSQKPNIIWISLDTQRAQSLEIYGNEIETSPFLKDFANKNIIFEKDYAQSSVTWTSHFSMLSSLYPIKHEILDPIPVAPAKRNVKMAAQYFKELGYETFLAGTFHGNNFFRIGFGIERGFDYILPFDALRSYELTISKIKEVLSFKKPFFVFLHTYIVHGPYNLEDQYFEKYRFPYNGNVPLTQSDWIKKFNKPITENNKQEFENFVADNFFSVVDLNNAEDIKRIKGAYYAAMNYQDHQLGELFKELKKTIPNFDKTIIVITADHGESFGENNIISHASYYQSNLWVPLIMRVPRYSKVRIKTPVRSIDILPTLLELAGGKGSSSIDGKSFAYLFEAPDTAQHYNEAFAQKSNRYVVFKDGWKYFYVDGKKEALYDLQSDPQEEHNLIETEPDKAFKMRSLIVNYQMTKPVN